MRGKGTTREERMKMVADEWSYLVARGTARKWRVSMIAKKLRRYMSKSTIYEYTRDWK